MEIYNETRRKKLDEIAKAEGDGEPHQRGFAKGRVMTAASVTRTHTLALSQRSHCAAPVLSQRRKGSRRRRPERASCRTSLQGSGAGTRPLLSPRRSAFFCDWPACKLPHENSCDLWSFNRTSLLDSWSGIPQPLSVDRCPCTGLTTSSKTPSARLRSPRARHEGFTCGGASARVRAAVTRRHT